MKTYQSIEKPLLFFAITKFFSSSIVRWICAGVICIIVLLTWGCAPVVSERVVYRELKMPVQVPCVVELPVKPDDAESAVEMNLKILKYARELESALRKCTSANIGGE